MRFRSPLLSAVVLTVLVAPAVRAQDGFLFKQPIGYLTFRAGPMMHSANGELYDFITSELTLDRKDFRAPSLGVEFGMTVHDRVDIAFGAGWSEIDRRSEMREWLDQDDLPIQQTTKLRTVPVTLSARYYPLSRGEALSRLAWVPRKVTPYIGGGAGMTWYALEQKGDFVQASDLSVFWDDFDSSDQAFMALAMAGTDVWLSSKVGVNLEARYTHGSAPLNQDFSSYNTLDLSGFQAGLGLTIRW